jgi:hypothetical protein
MPATSSEITELTLPVRTLDPTEEAEPAEIPPSTPEDNKQSIETAIDNGYLPISPPWPRPRMARFSM